MTFYEAAIEVLKEAKRPLHYKKITEIAIKRNLLSHVGRTPEVTMGARLGQELQRNAESGITKTRPGVYALRAWDGAPPEPTPEPQVENAPRRRRQRGRGKSTDTSTSSSSSQPLSAVNLYQDDESFEDEMSETEEAPEVAPQREQPKRDARPAATPAPQDASRPRKQTQPRAETQPRKQSQPRAETKPRPQSQPRAAAPKPTNGKATASAEDGANLVVRLSLQALRKKGKPMSSQELSEALTAAGRGQGSHAAAFAALVTDNHVRQTQGHRPRFVQLADGWGLSEWALDDETLALEESLHASILELHENTINALAVKLSKLSLDAWQHLVLALLKRIGYLVLGQTRSADDTVVIRAEHKVGVSKVRIAIQLVHTGRLEAPAVTQLRGTLHHHDSSRGVIFTTGHVSEAAMAEGEIQNLPPITLIGRTQLAGMLLDAGIGVRRFDIPAHYIDHSFFAALTN